MAAKGASGSGGSQSLLVQAMCGDTVAQKALEAQEHGKTKDALKSARKKSYKTIFARL